MCASRAASLDHKELQGEGASDSERREHSNGGRNQIKKHTIDDVVPCNSETRTDSTEFSEAPNVQHDELVGHHEQVQFLHTSEVFDSHAEHGWRRVFVGLY